MTNTVRISKEVQFDAGHRVPNHASKCKNPHGHRYRVVVHCAGEIIDDPEHESDGMLAAGSKWWPTSTPTPNGASPVWRRSGGCARAL